MTPAVWPLQYMSHTLPRGKQEGLKQDRTTQHSVNLHIAHAADGTCYKYVAAIATDTATSRASARLKLQNHQQRPDKVAFLEMPAIPRFRFDATAQNENADFTEMFRISINSRYFCQT